MWQTPSERKQELTRRLIILFALILVLLSLGTLAYHMLEGWSYVDSLYYSSISLTSRGYSNMHPTNLFSTLFSVLYLIIGAALLVYGLSTLIAHYTTFYQPKIENKLHHIVNSITHKNDKWFMVRSRKRDLDPNAIGAKMNKPDAKGAQPPRG
jgi:voltage-gated potassium channel